LDLRYFNAEARKSIEWTQSALSADNKAYLKSLPPISLADDYTLAHGSPRQPIEEYILDPLSAEYNFSAFETRVCLVGHTHWPTTYYQNDVNDSFCVQRPPRWNECIALNHGRWIVNPGSVGQPRDGNPDASYALLDVESGEWEYRRVAYPVEVTQAKMRQFDLPGRLIERLAMGH
jgi:diadenosine tetraphosphatase ApaH/serine/threonine PP2A family protein phosphatase